MTSHFETPQDIIYNILNVVDRLKLENQQLLSRVDGLKNPVRPSSVFRTEAIAELDRLAGGN